MAQSAATAKQNVSVNLTPAVIALPLEGIRKQEIVKKEIRNIVDRITNDQMESLIDWIKRIEYEQDTKEAAERAKEDKKREV